MTWSSPAAPVASAGPSVEPDDRPIQAPTSEAAATLANAAVDGLRAYLGRLALTQDTPAASQIRLVQLGRANGAVINGGVNAEVALLVFFLTLCASLATVVFLSRVREGWRLSAVPGRAPTG